MSDITDLNIIVFYHTLKHPLISRAIYGAVPEGGLGSPNTEGLRNCQDVHMLLKQSSTHRTTWGFHYLLTVVQHTAPACSFHLIYLAVTFKTPLFHGTGDCPSAARCREVLYNISRSGRPQDFLKGSL